MISRTIAAGAIAMAVAGCAANPTEGQLWGTGAGACPGALTGGVGAAIATTAAVGIKYAPFAGSAGYLAGGMVGFVLSDRFDPASRRMWVAATIAAAETGKPGEPITWKSPNHRGAVTVIGDGWTDAGGRACRLLRQEASGPEGENPYTRQVVACRVDGDGWEVTEPMADQDDHAAPGGVPAKATMTLPAGQTVEAYPHPCQESWLQTPSK